MKRYFVPFIICALAFLLLGCQWIGNQQEPPTPVKTEVRLLGWKGTPAADQRLQQTIERILEVTNTVSISIELSSDYENELQTALESDFPPDIIYLESGRLVDLATKGLLRPIGSQIENNDDFFPVLRDTFTFRGVYYCPPREFSTLAVIFNRQMFDDASVAYPDSSWSWQDFSNAAIALTNPNKAIVGLGLGTDLSRWLPALYAAGGRLTNDTETEMAINSLEATAGFRILDDLWTDFYAVRPADVRATWAGDAFGKQRVAMVIEGDWIVPFLQNEYPEVQFGVVEMPIGALGKSTIAFSSCLAIPAKAPHPNEALWLINKLVTADSLRLLLNDTSPLPPRISLAEEWQTRFPEQSPFLTGIDYAQPWRFFPGFDALKSNIEGNLQRMYKAEIMVEALLSGAEEAGNAALQSELAK